MFLLIFCVAFLSTALGQLACPAGWTLLQDSKSCYFVHVHGKYTWLEAKTMCDTHNAHIARIESGVENTFVLGLIQGTNNKHSFTGGGNPNVWLGATDEIQEGKFVWYGVETAVTFNDWAPGEPNHHTEDCLVMWSNFGWQWADYDCHGTAYFVCEKSATETEIVG